MISCTNSIGIIDGVVPPARQFIERGGILGLGSDQSAGNNSHNIFSEMRATAMFAKIQAGSPLAIPCLASAPCGDYWRSMRVGSG